MRRPVALLAATMLGTPAWAQDAPIDPVRDAADGAEPLPHGSDSPNPPPDALLTPAPPLPDRKAMEPQPVTPDELDNVLLDGRRRPGVPGAPLPEGLVQNNPGAVGAPPISAFPADQIPVPDRWRLVKALCPDRDFRAIQAACRSWRDPYRQNVLKGDIPLDPDKIGWLPIKGHDWFAVLSAVSDSVVEPRSFPLPVGVQTTERPGSNDVFGRASSLLLAQTFTLSAALIKGATAFKPPDVEYRVTLAVGYNYADVSERRILNVASSAPSYRHDAFVGVQEAFVDKHLRNVSDRYDFDSIRIGIQPFQADFRGFLFNDSQPGVRLFGNRDDNRWQYNIALFGRLEKDTNSGLNDITQRPRRDLIAIANLYHQDFPVPGFTSQGVAAYNRNREAGDIQIDHNGFPVRPALIGNLHGRDYDVAYIGYNGDGRFGRINLTLSAYVALGEDRDSIFTGQPAKIRAFFLAAEPSYDVNWARFRLSALYASGDSDPFDDTETGYDAIFENPIFAGADTSYWIRQSIPFAGGGRAVGLSGRNGVLPSLRSSKEEGQSNFNNPGLMLFGAGVDADITPTVRVTANANYLSFARTEVLQTLRNEGSIPREIGLDTSLSVIWRPQMTQNIVVRGSLAVLHAGDGFRDLFTQASKSGRYYSGLLNVLLSY